MAQKTWPDDFPEAVGEKVMMDSSGSGSEAERVQNLLVWVLLLIVGGLGVVIWMLKEDLIAASEGVKAEKFDNCVEQMERMQPDLGVKYKTIECKPDGTLSVTAVYAQ